MSRIILILLKFLSFNTSLLVTNTCKLIKTRKCEQCYGCEFLAYVLLESTLVCPFFFFWHCLFISSLGPASQVATCGLECRRRQVSGLLWGHDKGACSHLAHQQFQVAAILHVCDQLIVLVRLANDSNMKILF